MMGPSSTGLTGVWVGRVTCAGARGKVLHWGQQWGIGSQWLCLQDYSCRQA